MRDNPAAGTSLRRRGDWKGRLKQFSWYRYPSCFSFWLVLVCFGTLSALEQELAWVAERVLFL